MPSGENSGSKCGPGGAVSCRRALGAVADIVKIWDVECGARAESLRRSPHSTSATPTRCGCGSAIARMMATWRTTWAPSSAGRTRTYNPPVNRTLGLGHDRPIGLFQAATGEMGLGEVSSVCDKAVTKTALKPRRVSRAVLLNEPAWAEPAIRLRPGPRLRGLDRPAPLAGSGESSGGDRDAGGPEQSRFLA